MADNAVKAKRAHLPADERMRRNRITGFGIAMAIFALDQITKWIVIYQIRLPERPALPGHSPSIELLPFFNLTWVQNFGVSMGFLTAGTDLGRWALVGLTAAIALGVAIWMWREKSRGDTIALSLVLGGALGNIVDRSRYGYVADFLDLHIGEWRPFLVFNVADAAITIGVLLLLVRALLTPSRKDK